MKHVDIQMCREHFENWARKVRDHVNTVLLLSESIEQQELTEKLFPDATISRFEKGDWDLSRPGPCEFDLIMALGIFMGSDDPDLWFENVLARCRWLWMQDLIRARRAGSAECATFDGDRMRYCWPPEHLAKISNAYDLRKLGERILDFHPYHSDGQVDGLSFLLNAKGDLCYNPPHGNQEDPHISGSVPQTESQRVDLGDGQRPDGPALSHDDVQGSSGDVGVSRKRRRAGGKPDRDRVPSGSDRQKEG